jgi:hypothetical protein
MSLEEFCRRQWRNRSTAIREQLDRRRTTIAEAAGTMSDQEKVQSESYKRLLRARTLGTKEG